MWKKVCKDQQATDEHMKHANFMLVTRATDIHSEYIMRIAFTSQHWLHLRALTL
jgi:hypothetical protein